MIDTKALREKILDLAIRGKLVPQDPNDEPASVLLERIRTQKQQMVNEGKLKPKDIKNDTIIFKGEDNLHYEKFQDGTVKCIEDEITFEVPEGWAWCRLNALSENITDGDHQPPPQTKYGIPFLVISNVSDGNIHFENTRYVSEEYYNQLSNYRKAQKGDLLFTVTGSYGIPIVVDTETPFCFQRHIAIIRPCVISNAYLSIVLGSMYIRKQCDELSTGTAQKTVGLTTMRNFLIPVPPFVEQSAIIEKAKEALSLTALIQVNKDSLAKAIARVKSKVLDLAIRGKLVPQNPNDEPASVLLERIRAEKEELIAQGKIKRNKKESIIFKGEDNSYYRDIPKNWELCSILNIAEVELGKTLDKEKNTGKFYPYLRSINIKWNDIDLTDLKQMRFEPEEIERYSVQKNDLLICEGGDVGRCCVWKDEPILYQNALHRVRFYGSCNPYFFMYTLMLLESIGYLKSISNGVTIKHLTKNVLSTIQFPLPPLAEQKRIVEAIKSAFAQLDHIINCIS